MRYHAYALKNPKSQTSPYVLDLQSNLLDSLKSRVVAPLRQYSAVGTGEVIQDLMPVFSIGGESYVLVIQEMASYPVAQMAHVVADLTPHSATIMNSLDRLLS